MEKEITCIICPIGCKLMVQYEDGKIKRIENFQCKKGKEYAVVELLNPVRTLTTTTIVNGGAIPLVSVKTDRPIPKNKLFDVMDVVAKVEINTPLKVGDVLIENVIDLGADIIVTKNVDKTEG